MSDFLHPDTLALHAGAEPDARHGSRAVPIHQTTSYLFKSAAHAAALYNFEQGGHLYSRISNPTVAALEQRVAALEGGSAATACASGMAGLHLVVAALCSAGDHIVSTSALYGGNVNLLKNTMPRFGVETTFVAPDDFAGLEAAIQPNTRMVFGEVIGNPALALLDVRRAADIAHAAGLPLVLDATFNTPYLMRPFDHGADVLVHSLTKWMGGHGVAIGGVVVEGGAFDWGGGRHSTIDGSFYALDGINFWEEYGPTALTSRIRMEGMYNFGPALSPQNAFYILQGLETLPLRMAKHMENTRALLEYLSAHEQVAWVKHPDLPDHPDHALAKEMLPRGAGSMVAFGVKGGRAAGTAFIEAVQVASHLANVGDAKTLVIHPASTTHSHIDAEAMKAGGLSEDMIRLSVGLEHIDDLKADFDRAFKAAARAAGA